MLKKPVSAVSLFQHPRKPCAARALMKQQDKTTYDSAVSQFYTLVFCSRMIGFKGNILRYFARNIKKPAS
jgi:hypothetical protein